MKEIKTKQKVIFKSMVVEMTEKTIISKLFAVSGLGSYGKEKLYEEKAVASWLKRLPVDKLAALIIDRVEQECQEDAR